MKLLRIAGLSLFLISALTFAGYRGYEAGQNDYLAPVIEFEGDCITAEVKVTEQELLRDVKAFDTKDGEVTDSLLIESISDFVGPGERIITYAAFDSFNNVAKRERRLIYTDYIPPKFSLLKPLRFAKGEAVDLLENLRAFDCIDGDLSENIKYDEPDYYFGTTEDAYTIEFKVTNSAGDTSSLPVEVEFYNPAYNEERFAPKLLLKDYLVYLKEGDPFDPAYYLKSVTMDEKEYGFQEDSDIGYGQISKDTISKKSVLMTSNVSMRKPGIYKVKYSMQAQNGYTGTTNLLVVVEE